MAYVSNNAKYRWVTLFLAWLIYFYFGMIMVSIPPFLTLIIRDLNLNYFQAGVILSCWQLTYTAVAFLAGLLIDRVGVKISLAFGVAVISISAVLRGVATNFETMLMAVAIFGVGGPLISVGLPKLVASYFLGKERGMATGLYITGATVGSAVSLAIANSVLLQLVGTWRNALRLYAVFGMLVLMVWLLAGREPISISEQLKRRSSSMFKFISILLKSKNVRLTVMIGFSGFFVVHGLRNWLPKILESKGIAPTTAGLIASIHTIMYIVGSLIVPRLSYRVEPRKFLLIPSILLGGTSLLPLTASNGGLFMWTGLIINGLTCGGILPLMMVFLMETPEVGVEYLGGAVGLYFTFGEIGGFSASVLIGYLRDLTGSFLLGIGVLILVLQITILPAFYLKRHNSVACALMRRQN